ncbi:hypothetical protein C0995_016173 [Termitomyces sp. Mi166|nr:hypothetical protein C0995_016173 [Termitomyces sp. Mi166\
MSSTIVELIAYCNWVANNDLTYVVILTALDKAEYKGLHEDKTAANLYAQVKAHAKVMAKHITDIVTCIFAIKELDKDLFKVCNAAK